MSSHTHDIDYLEYWQLEQKPFENTRSPYFFFESREHKEALERILYVIDDQNMGMGMISGEIGSGKTCVKTVVEEGLSQDYHHVVSLENCNFPFEHLLLEINRQMAEEESLPQMEREKYFLLNEFKELLQHKIQPHRHLVIMVDEAQEIPEEALVELKNLTNISDLEQNFLTLVFFGQPELREKVKKFPQVNQRISLRFHINGISAEEIREYIRFRLRKGGHLTGDIFSEDTYKYIFRETRGIPREINRICKLALDRAFALHLPQVNDRVILAIIRDLYKQDGEL